MTSVFGEKSLSESPKDKDDAFTLSSGSERPESTPESRIDAWLSDLGVTRCSVEDKKDQYSNRQKSLSLSTNASTVAPFVIGERMMKSSLLKRRKLLLGKDMKVRT